MADKPKPKTPKIVHYSLPDASRVSEVVPDDVKIAIADAIMAFSFMEMSAELFVWDICGLSSDDGKLLTSIDTSEKLDLAKKFSERYGLPIHENAAVAAEIWSVIKQVVQARNKIAHGVWKMIDGKTPTAYSYRIPAAPGQIMGEEFPRERLDLFIDNCSKIKLLFDQMSQRLAAMPEKPKPVAVQAQNYPDRPLPKEPDKD